MQNGFMLFFLLVSLGLIGFYFYTRRFKIKAVPVEKDHYRILLEEHVFFYQALSSTQKLRFLDEVIAFIKHVHIEGVGTAITDLDKVLVASSAVIPIFSFQGWHYPNLTNVILYPETFNQAFAYEGARRNTLGMVGDGFMNGQMVLSKKALHEGFSKQSHHDQTAIHEFVHLMDKSDGSIDGVPELFLGQANISHWIHLIHQEMQRIAKGKSDINPYALTNTSEFFAVAAEYFFTDPKHLQQKHPELFNMLQEIFKAR